MIGDKSHKRPLLGLFRRLSNARCDLVRALTVARRFGACICQCECAAKQHADALVIHDEKLTHVGEKVRRTESRSIPFQLAPPTRVNLPQPSVGLAVLIPKFRQVAFIQNSKPNDAFKHQLSKREFIALNIQNQSISMESHSANNLAGVAPRFLHN